MYSRLRLCVCCKAKGQQTISPETSAGGYSETDTRDAEQQLEAAPESVRGQRPWGSVQHSDHEEQGQLLDEQLSVKLQVRPFDALCLTMPCLDSDKPQQQWTTARGGGWDCVQVGVVRA
jgi:hypothetical protein